MTEDDRKVRALPDRETDEGKARLERMRRLIADRDTLTEEARIAATLCKVRYDALIESGFTEEQALEIVSKRF